MDKLFDGIKMGEEEQLTFEADYGQDGEMTLVSREAEDNRLFFEAKRSVDGSTTIISGKPFSSLQELLIRLMTHKSYEELNQIEEETKDFPESPDREKLLEMIDSMREIRKANHEKYARIAKALYPESTDSLDKDDE